LFDREDWLLLLVATKRLSLVVLLDREGWLIWLVAKKLLSLIVVMRSGRVEEVKVAGWGEK
jgi:hypothetical protein